jgi:hypothetical protein
MKGLVYMAAAAVLMVMRPTVVELGMQVLMVALHTAVLQVAVAMVEM